MAPIERDMDDEIIPPVERMLAVRACERIIVDFIHRLDLGDPSSALLAGRAVFLPFGADTERLPTPDASHVS